MKNNLLSVGVNKYICMILSAIFLYGIVHTAWMSDDARITFRVVLNFLHGYGPTFNIDERVQAYTHPLWFLLLSGLTCLTRNIYVSAFALSFIFSITAFWLLLTRFSKNTYVILTIAGALIFSKAYIDFSTSGLENPLSNFILILTVLFAIPAVTHKKKSYLIGYFICSSLLYLNRADLVQLIFPLTLYVIFENRRQPKIIITSFCIGISPAVAWSLFSLYYYGFLFPNTAYAKLDTGLALHSRITQGLKYFLNSFYADPITCVTIFSGLIIGMRRLNLNAMLSAGIILYLFYILYVGGDFMSGRFLVAPLLLSTIVIARTEWTKATLSFLAGVIIILGVQNIQATLLSSAHYHDRVIKNGIADERGYYFKNHGLIMGRADRFRNPSWTRGAIVNKVIKVGVLGGPGLQYGPSVHLFDFFALCDPLLSHLPTIAGARIGHFYREIPENYFRSLELNQNLLADPHLYACYDSIRKVTRGDLNDVSRWKEIILINFTKKLKNNCNASQ